MKYKDLIDAMTPYADEEVDALIDGAHQTVSFWYGGGEDEIATFDVHQ